MLCILWCMQIPARFIHGENKTLQSPQYLCPVVPKVSPCILTGHQSHHPAHGSCLGKATLAPLLCLWGSRALVLLQNRMDAHLSLGNENE